MWTLKALSVLVNDINTIYFELGVCNHIGLFKPICTALNQSLRHMKFKQQRTRIGGWLFNLSKVSFYLNVF